MLPIINTVTRKHLAGSRETMILPQTVADLGIAVFPNLFNRPFPYLDPLASPRTAPVSFLVAMR